MMRNLDTPQEQTAEEKIIEQHTQEFTDALDKQFQTETVKDIWNQFKKELQIHINPAAPEPKPSIEQEDQNRIDQLLVLDASVKEHDDDPTKTKLDRIKQNIKHNKKEIEKPDTSIEDIIEIKQTCCTDIKKLKNNKEASIKEAINSLIEQAQSVELRCADIINQYEEKQRRKNRIQRSIKLAIGGVVVIGGATALAMTK